MKINRAALLVRKFYSAQVFLLRITTVLGNVARLEVRSPAPSGVKRCLGTFPNTRFQYHQQKHWFFWQIVTSTSLPLNAWHDR